MSVLLVSHVTSKWSVLRYMREVVIARGNGFHGSQLKKIQNNLANVMAVVHYVLLLIFVCDIRIYSNFQFPPTECLSCEFSGFCRGVVEGSSLLGYYSTPLGVSKRRGSIAQ